MALFCCWHWGFTAGWPFQLPLMIYDRPPAKYHRYYRRPDKSATDEQKPKILLFFFSSRVRTRNHVNHGTLIWLALISHRRLAFYRRMVPQGVESLKQNNFDRGKSNDSGVTGTKRDPSPPTKRACHIPSQGKGTEAIHPREQKTRLSITSRETGDRSDLSPPKQNGRGEFQ